MRREFDGGRGNYRGSGYYRGEGLRFGYGGGGYYGYGPSYYTAPVPACGFYDRWGYWHADPACYVSPWGY